MSANDYRTENLFKMFRTMFTHILNHIFLKTISWKLWVIYIKVTNFCWFAWDFFSLHTMISVFRNYKSWTETNEWSPVTMVPLSLTTQIQHAPVHSSSNVPHVRKKWSRKAQSRDKWGCQAVKQKRTLFYLVIYSRKNHVYTLSRTSQNQRLGH